jgi:hypothetical protein
MTERALIAAQKKPDVPLRSSCELTHLGAAQRDMRNAYLGGATGMLASALVWAAAGCVATWMSLQHAVWTLFIGGVFIHPVGMLLARVLGRTGKHASDNPLGALAMATTVWMIMMLPLAYGISLWRADLFFPAMLLVIGGRYLCFQVLYGSRLYWVCGALLAMAAYGLAALHAPPALGGFAGAAIEAVFAAVLLVRTRQAARTQHA